MRDLFESPGRYIMRVSNGIKHQLDSFVADTSMTNAEARVLQFIAAARSPVYQKDIETEYGYTAATVSELMQGMEQKGLVQRQTDPADRRRKCLTIPEAIRPQVEAMRGRMVRMEAALIEGLSEDEIEIFMKVIRRMSTNIPPKAD